ncbi:MAG: GxxExxY protein [Verrucomicrobiia bacterium]
MSELLYRKETRRLIGLCMKIHHEPGKAHDEVIYQDALVEKLSRANVPFARENKYAVNCKGAISRHFYRADFVVGDKILFEAKAVEQDAEALVMRVLDYLAAAKLRLGLLVNFGADSLEWKGVIL